MIESRLVDFWRRTERELQKRRWRPIPLGRVRLYWQIGFTAAQAAEAEILKGRH